MTDASSLAPIITTQDALADALESIAEAPWVAFDTEFLRERTYYPQLCVVQIATPKRSFCVDTLIITDLTSLHEFLADPCRHKIVHAARQDLEALSRSGEVKFLPLFDTQIAAALTGFSEQIAYAGLVEACCGVTLDKSQTRTDWAQRPLAAEQLSYALADVEYLGDVQQALALRLEAYGKQAWLREEGERLIASISIDADPATAWRKLRGIGSLNPAAQRKARTLATWREGCALTLDRPRGWLLKDDALLALATESPTDLVAMARLPNLPPGTIRRYGVELLELLHSADTDAADEDEDSLLRWRLSGTGQTLLTELQAAVKARAAEVTVAPTLVASRRDLEALILGDPPARLVTGWRESLIGTALVAQAAQVPLADRRIAAAPRI
jgi:ribonuclease D